MRIAYEILIGNTEGRNCLCDLVVRVLGYRSRAPGLILGTTRFPDK
jgi:hypothetical protein